MKLNEYQKEAAKLAIYPGQGTPVGLMYIALKLNGEAGEFAEHLGKAIRDDELIENPRTEYVSHLSQGDLIVPLNDLWPGRKELLVKELGDVLWYIANGAKELGLTLEDVAKTNLNKLNSRKYRDKIKGSGDNR